MVKKFKKSNCANKVHRFINIKNPIALLLFSGLFIILTAFLFSQSRVSEFFPEIYDWEDEVTPPPSDDWIKHMPSGYVPEALPSHVVRTAYVIPSNRTMQDNAIEKLRYMVLMYQDWCREQMERNRFSSKTFLYETEADGITPKINVVYAPNTDDYYRTDPWTRVAQACQNAGLPIWSSGQVWMITYEAHVMNPDGSITGGFNGGATWGSGSDGGVGMTCACTLALVTPEDLIDDRNYDGLIVPELGPYPMKYLVTAAWYDGNTISSLSSVDHGIFIHETSHGFYLWHDFRNDSNFDGNMMGNGFRGVRGWVHPDRYPDNEFRLEYGDALALNVNRYFNASQVFTDNVKPTASILTTGYVDPVNGLLEIRFTASDASGLALVFLRLDGNTIGEMHLQGTSVDKTFQTTYYTPGQNNSYAVTVYDIQGNTQNATATINPNTGFNRAPVPFLRIKPSKVIQGESITLDATRSTDPNSNYPLMVEWDLNGDEVFDTPPSTVLTYTTQFNEVGTRLIRARLTDSLGAQTISTAIGVRVVELVTGVFEDNWAFYE